jgi:hypothetical protein
MSGHTDCETAIEAGRTSSGGYGVVMPEYLRWLQRGTSSVRRGVKPAARLSGGHPRYTTAARHSSAGALE